VGRRISPHLLSWPRQEKESTKDNCTREQCQQRETPMAIAFGHGSAGPAAQGIDRVVLLRPLTPVSILHAGISPRTTAFTAAVEPKNLTNENRYLFFCIVA
jgi:hypothetical protein